MNQILKYTVIIYFVTFVYMLLWSISGKSKAKLTRAEFCHLSFDHRLAVARYFDRFLNIVIPLLSNRSMCIVFVIKKSVGSTVQIRTMVHIAAFHMQDPPPPNRKRNFWGGGTSYKCTANCRISKFEDILFPLAHPIFIGASIRTRSMSSATATLLFLPSPLRYYTRIILLH